MLDPTVWGVGTILADPAPPPQINHGPHAVATNLLRYLGPDVTLVSGPAGQPVVLAFASRRLFAVIVLTIRESPRDQDRGDRRPVGAGGSRSADVTRCAVATEQASRLAASVRQAAPRNTPAIVAVTWRNLRRVAEAISRLTSMTPPGRRWGSKGTSTTGCP